MKTCGINFNACLIELSVTTGYFFYQKFRDFFLFVEEYISHDVTEIAAFLISG